MTLAQGNAAGPAGLHVGVGARVGDSLVVGVHVGSRGGDRGVVVRVAAGGEGLKLADELRGESDTTTA